MNILDMGVSVTSFVVPAYRAAYTALVRAVIRVIPRQAEPVRIRHFG